MASKIDPMLLIPKPFPLLQTWLCNASQTRNVCPPEIITMLDCNLLN